jgi:hypothetical protein
MLTLDEGCLYTLNLGKLYYTIVLCFDRLVGKWKQDFVWVCEDLRMYRALSGTECTIRGKNGLNVLYSEVE